MVDYSSPALLFAPGLKGDGSLPALIGPDESPVGYSLAGSSPAEPRASAFPPGPSLKPLRPNDNRFSANGELSSSRLSHSRGSPHLVKHPNASAIPKPLKIKPKLLDPLLQNNSPEERTMEKVGTSTESLVCRSLFLK